MTTVNQHHDDVVIDIKTKVKTMLDGAAPPVTGDCCIYRVPYHIRKLNEDAYTPRVVSIGPFHHDRLQNMQGHKLICCKAFLERAKTSVDILIQYIQKVEPKIRRCYSDTIALNKDELVELILVDSCFILEFFLKYVDYNRYADDEILLEPCYEYNIGLDLLLLENQIPFFVLDNIFNLSSVGSRSHSVSSFIELTFYVFAHWNRSKLLPPVHDTSRIRHFTDLIRTFHLKHPHLPKTSSITSEPLNFYLPSATAMLEAGVKFKANTTTDGECCLLDIKFSGGVLEIPKLVVDDETETLFQNMVAFEHWHYPYKSYITYYVCIWDFLINTNRDVELLVRKKVLVNWHSTSDSAAKLFNSLLENITFAECSEDYLRLCKELNTFCEDPWRQKKATLRRDYCNTRWKTVGTIAGILIVVLTILQSVCSVLQIVQ